MVKVSMAVRSGAARFNVGVEVESIQRAVSLARGRYPNAQRSGAVPNLAHLAG